MLNQTESVNSVTETPVGKTAKPPRKLNLNIFYAFIGLAVVGIALEQILLPDLRSNLLILFIVTFTTLFSLLSIGLSVSGLRARLPKSVQLAVSGLVWGFVLLDVIFLILPSVLPGATSNDAPVNFAAPPAAVSKTTQPTSMTTVTSFKTWQADFNNQGDHAVVGKVTLGKTSEGKTLLRFENLNSPNGPDLHVYLSKNASPGTPDQVKNGLEVGKLKATQGSLNYELDSTLDLTQYKSVVIYCQAVSAIFGYANLQ